MKTVLNTSIEIHNKTVPNRIVFQPMEGCDGTPEGGIDALTRRRYIRFAKAVRELSGLKQRQLVIF